MPLQELLGNASILITALQKACAKLTENLIILQGLGQIIDISMDYNQLKSNIEPMQMLIDANGQIFEYLRNKGWVCISADVMGMISVQIRFPFYNSLETTDILNFYHIKLPICMYIGSKNGNNLTYITGGPGGDGCECVGSKWQSGQLAANYTQRPQEYINDNINLQKQIENLNSMLNAFDIMN